MYIYVGNLQRNVNNLLCRSKFTYFKLKRIDSEHMVVVPCDSVYWILFTGLLKNGHNGNHIELIYFCQCIKNYMYITHVTEAIV